MGSFSWYASDTKRAIRSHNPFPVYALRPDADPLLETEYDGYGEFGGQDIYDLVADWNRKYLSEHPGFVILPHGHIWSEEMKSYLPIGPKRIDELPWYRFYADLSKTRRDIEIEMRKSQSYWEYRHIGIEIACYDDRNMILPYPIKLVEHPIPYPAAAASKHDPGQGWGKRDRFEGDPIDSWGYDDD